MLILSIVIPGKTYNCQQLQVGSGLTPGYDSHGFRPDENGCYEELVIFDPDQILPKYVINYNLK